MSVKKIAIIGVGLIGGSLGKALKKAGVRNPKVKITGIGRNIEKLKLAKKLNAIDDFTLDYKEGVKDADIIVLCTPVDNIVPFFEKILPHLKNNAIVTDAGSVKTSIVTGINKILIKSRKKIHFIGSHPLAGSEKTGVNHAAADLYKNAAVVLTPLKTDDKLAAGEIACLWESTGAKIFFMTPQDHDSVVSATSHLPHVLSGALVEIVNRKNIGNGKTAALLAGSFRDITRISDSDPGIWSAISYANKKELNKAISEYIGILKKVQSELNNTQKLHKYFTDSRQNRCQLLKSNRN
ncbi:MAG: hypothetical protein A2252_11345 [Elusimicrobia bacterium RIFOXYA2_FULL_39_19]|nr:MAG: hypothetical protein A2252_11345 [Elusimicrobia bacterium RIFOXYA2_FULL_39_19]